MRTKKICVLLTATAVLFVVAHLLLTSISITTTSELVGLTSSSSSSSTTTIHDGGFDVPVTTTVTMAIPPEEEEYRYNHHNHQQTSPPLPPQLLLNVPFYVYEDLAWLNATMGTEPILAAVTRRQKHALDYWWMIASLNHPMRTTNPEEAKLFVIPLLLNMYTLRVYDASNPSNPFHNVSEYRNTTMCWNGMCDKTLLKYAGRILNESSWFHRNDGKDHIAVTSHFGYRLKGKLKMPPLLRKAIYKCNSICFENRIYNDARRITYPSILVGNVCPYESQKTHQVSFIGTLKDPTELNYHDRQNICQWVYEMEKDNDNDVKQQQQQTKEETSSSSPTTTIVGSSSSSPPLLPLVSICGKGEQCPALAQARFGFHARGDTFGSQRLMDAILSGTVPLFTRVEQYNIVPSWINWTDISYFINVSDRTSFRNSLQRILKASPEEYEQRHQAVVSNRDLFDWTSLVPFDTYMYMLQVDSYPETKHPPHKIKNRYSALILP